MTTTTIMTARDAAEQITATYDSASQFAKVARRGAGEWEIDRAAEIADESEELTTAEIVVEIESICRAKAEIYPISICRDGVWAGSGLLVNGHVEDCGAVLGVDQDDSDETYEVIEECIEDGLDNAKIDGYRYSWEISK